MGISLDDHESGDYEVNKFVTLLSTCEALKTLKLTLTFPTFGIRQDLLDRMSTAIKARHLDYFSLEVDCCSLCNSNRAPLPTVWSELLSSVQKLYDSMSPISHYVLSLDGYLFGDHDHSRLSSGSTLAVKDKDLPYLAQKPKDELALLFPEDLEVGRLIIERKGWGLTLSTLR